MRASSSGISQADVLPIRRLLQINVCILCCLSGLMFAVAEGNPLGLINVPVAVAGLLLTDLRRAFALPAWLANLLGLGAFVAAGYEFFGPSMEGRLLGFGHLLLFLGWILLLQRKAKPQFWWLCALSVLQVATSAVLTNDLWFPLTAMLYTMLALWTLSIFSLDRAVSRSAGVEREAEGMRPASALSRTSTGADESLESSGVSRSRSNVRSESASHWVTPRFVVGVVLNGVLSILLGLAIFIVTPRIWAGDFRLGLDNDYASARPLTGFTEEVSLGDMGEILENPDLVLEVAFFDEQTDEPLDVEKTMERLGYDAPLFRGKVLGRYQEGRWSTPNFSASRESSGIPRRTHLIRQEIAMHPIGTRTLFTGGRAVTCRTEDRLEITHDRFSDTFAVESNPEARRRMQGLFEYSAYSAFSADHLLRETSPRLLAFRGQYAYAMTSLPPGLERLTALARRLARPKDGSVLSEQEIAVRLTAHLRDSGAYGYTLNVAVTDPTIDPVEDFLFNRREGHCEYFASALALMLRSVGIPARLVSGFKGGALNSATGLFEVRQLHAHAWVEVMVDGEWAVFDPTPATRDASVASINTSLSPYAYVQRFLLGWWSRGLLMNQFQQQRLIYEPLQDFLSGGLTSVRRVGLVQTLTNWFQELGRNPQELFSVRGFVTVFVLGLLGALLARVVRRIWRLLQRTRFARRRQSRQQRRIVGFYDRFRDLVARQGHVRDDVWTHGEFAARIERDWQSREGVDGLATLPTRLTDAFYRVRFGEQHLAERELADLDGALTRLEQWIKRPQQLPHSARTR